jgi:hypothetical protein
LELLIVDLIFVLPFNVGLVEAVEDLYGLIGILNGSLGLYLESVSNLTLNAPNNIGKSLFRELRQVPL